MGRGRIEFAVMLRACALLSLGAAPVACFSGDATIGSICGDAHDCGPEQQCRHELCGRCGNGLHEPFEVCYADPADAGGPTDIQRFRSSDLDRNGRDEVVMLDAAGALYHAPAVGGVLDPRMIALDAVVTTFAVGDVDGDSVAEIVASSGMRAIVLAADDEGVFAPAFELDVGRVIAELTIVPALEATATLAFVDADGSLFVVEPVADAVPQAVEVGTAVHLGPAVYFGEDDIVDLAVVDERQNRMAVVHGGAWNRVTRVDVGRGPFAVVAYDRDGDGTADFMTLDRFGRTVTLVAASLAGTLEVIDSLAFDTVPLAATAFDADFDGIADVFVATDDAIELWRGEGGRHPENVQFDTSGATALGVGRFSAAPVLDLVTLVGGELQRHEVVP
jgi:hypothetical protein